MMGLRIRRAWFLALYIGVCRAQYGVTVNFENGCEEALDISIEDDENGSTQISIDAGEQLTHTICSSLCTGWLGATYSYQYSWIATPRRSGCDFSDSGSGTLAISGTMPSGVSDDVYISCPDIVCAQEDQEEEDQEEGVNGSIASTPPREESCSSVTIADTSSPSPSDPLAGVMARLSSMAYSEKDEFQRAAGALVGASCVDFLYNSEGSEVGVAVNDDSIYIAFRGSETDSQGFQDDWLETNFQTSIINADAGDAAVNLHQGFYEAWKDSEKWIKNILKAYPDRAVYITGHSLGGAIAQIAGLMLEKDSNTLPVTAVYTFGAPPVGGDLWLAEMERSGMNDKVVNFVHPDDPVVFVQEAIESNLLGSILGSLTGITDDIRELRPAGRAADVTDSACVEIFPAFNDDSWSFDAHAIGSYQSLIDTNCILAEDSPYPECVPSTYSSGTESIDTCTDDDVSYDTGTTGNMNTPDTSGPEGEPQQQEEADVMASFSITRNAADVLIMCIAIIILV